MTKIILCSRWVFIISIGFGILLAALVISEPRSPVEAAPFADTYAVTWYTADNGGGISSGDSYEVAGTIGQMDADAAKTGVDYEMENGFWPAFIDLLYEVFLPVVTK